MKKVVICLISTKKYRIFVQPLVDSIKKNFLLRHQIEIVLFTDDISIPVEGDNRVKITKDLIPSYGFPEATLFRYQIMTSRKYDCDYLYYLDVDYLIVNEIDEEIFGDGIVAVLHPGFFSGVNGWGSWCDDKKSNAYTFPENRKKYYCGGTGGGSYEHYYRMMKRLAQDIDDDEKHGVRAEHNDEQHWNRYLSELKEFKILSPTYCMVEQEHLRKLWKIDHLPVKIIALDKDHAKMRS